MQAAVPIVLPKALQCIKHQLLILPPLIFAWAKQPILPIRALQLQVTNGNLATAFRQPKAAQAIPTAVLELTQLG